MRQTSKTILQLLAILVIGFTGGMLGNGVMTMINQHQIRNQKPGTPTTVSQTSYDNTTSTTEAVGRVQEAVVSVLNYQTESSEDLGNPYSIFGDDSQSSDGELVVAGEGSGVIYKIEGDSAYLVTNTHVVAGAQAIDIKLSDGTTVKGELVGSDTYSDIAVVKISSEKVKGVAEFGNSDQINVGEIAIAIGSPLGTEYANSVTQGIVSSLSRTVTSRAEDGQTVSTNAIQTDAAINPGNSGGPLINIQGQVIGITSSKITMSSSSVAVEGMGFAIPSNDAVAIINQLEQNGKVTRPALGIQMASLANLSSNDLEQLKIPDNLTDGIVVIEVQNGLSADGILQKYDIITKLGDQSVGSSSDLQSALYTHSIGDTITITFYRDGKEQTAEIKLTSSTEDLAN